MAHVFADRVRGCLYGGAVGDALGLPAEGRSSSLLAEALARRPAGAWPETYSETRQGDEVFLAGQWSDDTDQGLMVLETCLEAAECETELVDCTVLAAKLLAWKADGVRGMGGLTRAVLEHPHFAARPWQAAFQVWLAGGARQAPNGAVMRAAYGGLVNSGMLYATMPQPGGPTLVGTNAMRCAWTTHADPACQSSACAVADAVGQLVSERFTSDDRFDVAVEHAMAHLGLVNRELLDLDGVPLAALKLDEGLDESSRAKGRRAPIGHTYKALRAGFWALSRVRSGSSFSEVLYQVILAGGDADTNACVAGALMGAALGYEAIPRHLCDGLLRREVLDAALERVMAVNTGRER